MKKDNSGLDSLFSFEKRDIGFHMLYELKMSYKFESAFNYLIDKIGVSDIPENFDKFKWDEGKNYKWGFFRKDSIDLIIRQYRTHFTFYYKRIEQYNKYGCFTYLVDLEGMSDELNDAFIERPSEDLNKRIGVILDCIKEDKRYSFWNSYSVLIDKEKQRPPYIKMVDVWAGGDDVSNIDDFIFCCEELFSKYLEVFSETDMLEKIKTINIGDVLDTYKVENKITDVKDDYYHGIGLTLKNLNFKDSQSSWADVYSLSRYYLKTVFGEDLPLYESMKERK